ncbi:MAG: hypothetical protein AAGA48_29130 [Myxococcota bacterium]
MGHMLLAIAVFGCSGVSSDPEPAAEGTPEEAGAEAAEEPTNEPKDGFAIATTYLRSHATTERKIDDPDNPGKRISTYVATIYRGNDLTVVETKDDFVRVTLQDGSGNEGWIKGSRVTTADGAKLATVKEEVKTFSRPDLLSLNTTMKLAPGSVLVVTQSQGKFVEVDYPKSQWSSASTWVLADTVVEGEDDVAAAQLISKVLYVREDSAEKAKPLEELAREQFAGNALLNLLDPPEPEPSEEEEPEAGGDNLTPPAP